MVVHPEALVSKDVSILDNIEYHINGQVRAIPPAVAGKSNVLNLSREERRCVQMLLSDVLYPWYGAALVIEDFLLRKRSMDRELLSPVRLTAALEYAVEAEGLNMTLHRQQPAEAMTVATDERLKAWGLYKRAGGMQHARDADRHAITFFRKAKQRGSIRGAAWPHLYTPSGELRAGVYAVA
jgi:hypothetical protein